MKNPQVIMTQNGKPVAKVLDNPQGEKYTFKTIIGSKHMLRVPPSFAYDQFVLEQAEGYGVSYHVIKDKETNRVWSALHSDFEVHGIQLNRGFGVQIALPLSYWTEGSQPRKCEVIELFAPSQLDLFDTDQERAA
jgi:hypothetical protein